MFCDVGRNFVMFLGVVFSRYEPLADKTVRGVEKIEGFGINGHGVSDG